jgi:AmmeMemoRadiSam system protein B
MITACSQGRKPSVEDKHEEVIIQTVIPVKEDRYKERPPLLDSMDFINERSFYQSIHDSKIFQDSGEIVAGIIPHHDVACDYIAAFYKTVAEKKTPEVVILIGPNHPGDGPRFQIGHYDFKTRAGVVKSDSTIINNLYQNTFISEAITDVFEKEHSVGLHMNYINYFFQDANVVPIIIGETRNDEGIAEVAKQVVEEIKDKDALIIASIDFSHYLTLEEAGKKDDITRGIIENSNVNQMRGLGNDYIDSPSSYGLLIEMLNKMGITYTCKINGHDNSANIMGNEQLKETTSYFSVSYEKREITTIK